jgi:hypothetical protein
VNAAATATQNVVQSEASNTRTTLTQAISTDGDATRTAIQADGVSTRQAVDAEATQTQNLVTFHLLFWLRFYFYFYECLEANFFYFSIIKIKSQANNTNVEIAQGVTTITDTIASMLKTWLHYMVGL